MDAPSQDEQNHLPFSFDNYFNDAEHPLTREGWVYDDEMELVPPETMFSIPQLPLIIDTTSSSIAPSVPYLGELTSPSTSIPITSNNGFFPSSEFPNSLETDLLPNLFSPARTATDIDPMFWELGDMEYSVLPDLTQQAQFPRQSTLNNAPPFLQNPSLSQQSLNSKSTSKRSTSSAKSSHQASGASRISKSRSPSQPTSPSARHNHNEIEKRYRTSLNERYSILGEAIPERLLQEEANSKKKIGKAEILVASLKYIKELEATSVRLQAEKVGLVGSIGGWESAWREGQDKQKES